MSQRSDNESTLSSSTIHDADDLRITSITKPSQLPSHPVVNAFRTNLLHDISTQRHRSTSLIDCKDVDYPDDSNGEGDASSARMKKVYQALGWRNQYSQSPYYSITIEIPNEKRKYGHSDVIDGHPSTSPYTFQVRQVQRGEVENTYGTGATVWPASLVLMKYLENLSLAGSFDDTKKMTVADLGAGTGATSIVAALMCNASRVVCTDGSELVVKLAKDNIRQVVTDFHQNHEPHNIEQTMLDARDSGNNFMIRDCQLLVRQYMWGDGTMTKSGYEYDLIIASDCILPKLYPIAPFVDALDELSTQKTVTYITYEHRFYPEYDPKERFMTLATQKGFTVRVVPLSEQHPIYSVEDIEVWEVRRQ